MKITKTITIHKPAQDVWKIIAHDFDQAHQWMAPIPNARAIGKGDSALGAPMKGRLCDLSDKPNGAKAKEIITHYSEEAKTLAFDVLPVNNPAIVPLKKNHVQMSVKALDTNRSEVQWIAYPQLKTPAYLLYPLLRMALPLAFGNLLHGLKSYAENQTNTNAAPA